MKFHKHQIEASDRATEIANGKIASRVTVADVTTGGGKTVMAALFALQLLHRRVVDAVLFLVPRVTLSEQVDKDWSVLESNKELRAEGLRVERVVRNVAPLYRSDSVGAIANYNQVANNPDLYLEVARCRKTLVVLDEAQFLADKDYAAWSRAIKPIVDAAEHTLLMSGTIWRHDGELIPFVDYERRDDGMLYAKSDISFTLAQAIAAHVVKPVSFTLMNADVSYIYDGEERSQILSEAQRKERSRALRAFLTRRETWTSLTDRAIEHWQDFREHVYRSGMIVVAASQDHARSIVEYIEQKHKHKCALVISDEKTADEAARKFREERRPDIMVTVAKASVGYNAPHCTHMVYLSPIRSVPYAVQAIGRVTRMDRSCGIDPELQMAFVFAPNDHGMQEIATWMREQQAIGINDTIGDGPGPGPGPRASDFIATAANPLECSFDSQTQKITPQDSRRIERAMREIEGISHLPAEAILKILNYGAANASAQPTLPFANDTQSVSLTPTEERELLRTKVQQVTTAIDNCKLDINPEHKRGDTNRALIAATGKAVNDCSLEEMRARYQLALSWLKDAKQYANTRKN